MRRSWYSLALGALALLPTAGAAQNDNVMVFTSGGRPRIGVTVNMDASVENNRIGATISAVTPDGPAAKAGLQAGDIITRFNGIALADATPGDSDASAPGRKLVELAQALSPGDTVKLEYRRGTATRTATVVAADLGGEMFSWGGPAAGGQWMELQRAYGDRARAFADMQRAMGERELALELDGVAGAPLHSEGFMFRRGGLGLNLADMNAGLGEYFGTSKGVLVLENPADSTLPLKAGDVILAIDGRQPDGVGQALRIFASYNPGDTAKIEIMRLKKKSTVSWTVPAVTGRMRGPARMKVRTPGGATAAPVPSTPGSAPRAPAPPASVPMPAART